MNSAPYHRGWPALRDTSQTLLESTVHEIYRNAMLLVKPNTPLDPIILHRLRLLELPLHQFPVTRERLESSRKDLGYLVKQYGIYGVNFYREHMTMCINVLNMVFRLENLRDFEEDMKTRLTNRLRSLRMLRKWSLGSETWVWVLEMNEEVPEGLKTGKTKKQDRKKTGGQGDGDADAMDIDALFED